jgi:PIN domain nuclease of toxin-antitoxin system
VNLLLDSHVLLWALHDPEQLTVEAVEAVRNPRNAVFFSAASAWELELKAATGRLDLPADWLDTAEATGLLEIPVTAAVASLSAQLPWHHKDPFDRILVALALERGLRVATRDGMLASYGVPVLEA